ncbi:helix-turn-helix domain-containing protein [Agromyces archimandritae]|uniref:Helix-turn-helix domain-containing protein n=1 Tax=Agromyces archimandritae TaxID=2781962 RepID=A0A975FN86_9MICO|nr:helix-turn-helix domain-containing protein [Agromyces archimandritae]QTX04126.1 helix-turn-helix domain-containing protein [Agromyces archimandritae]
MPTATLSSREVARRLKTHPRQVARLVVRGLLIPAYQAPGPRGAYLFDAAEVDRFLAEHADGDAA